MFGRRLGVRAGVVAALGACALLLAACESEGPGPTEAGDPVLTAIAGVPTPSPVPSPVGMDDAAVVRVYVAVVAALLQGMSEAGFPSGTGAPPYVYISPYVGRGERLDDPDEGSPISPGLLDALPSRGGRPVYRLSEFMPAIGPLEEGGKVNNEGVFITLGPVAAGEEASIAVVRGSIYRQVGDAQGWLYRLRLDPSAAGDWQIVESIKEWNDG